MPKTKYKSKTIPTMVRIPKTIKEQAMKRAHKKQVSFSEYVIRLLESDLG